MSQRPTPLYYRERQLVGGRPLSAEDPTASPTAGLLPFSSATLWRKVKAGTFPRPVKLADKVTAWPPRPPHRAAHTKKTGQDCANSHRPKDETTW